MGAAASITGGGLFPYTIALLLAWPQLLLALPGYFTVSRARRAMEAWGAKAYLWAALAQPARVEWPLITWLLVAAGVLALLRGLGLIIAARRHARTRRRGWGPPVTGPATIFGWPSMWPPPSCTGTVPIIWREKASPGRPTK